jgi:hypothetical protein
VRRSAEAVHGRESLLQLPGLKSSPDGGRIEAGSQKLTTAHQAVLLPRHILPLHNTILKFFFCFTTYGVVKQNLGFWGSAVGT